jgi:AcrR family transcriptional regulator
MAQFKKEALRAAILDAAFTLFLKQGYANTTIGQIARKAGTAQGNVYHYYPSKFELFIAIFQPWFESKIDALEARLAGIKDPHKRLRTILLALWQTIPEADNGFHHNLMQALAIKKHDEHYSPTHLHKMEHRLAELIRPCLPPRKRGILDNGQFLHLLFMASDGFTISYKLVGSSKRVPIVVDMTCSLLDMRAGRQRRRGR